MFLHAHARASLWVDAFASSAYIINRLPSSVLNGKSSFELLFRTTPNYGNFHPFGCRVFPCLRDYVTNKLCPRSAPCIFIGYSSNYKGFRCLDPTSSRIYVTRNAQFDEQHFPFSCSAGLTGSKALDIFTFHEPIARLTTGQPTTSLSPHVHPTRPCTICTDPQPSGTTQAAGSAPTSPVQSSVHSPGTTLPVVQPPTTQPVPPSHPSHPMRTRSKDGIFKPKHFADLAHTKLF